MLARLLDHMLIYILSILESVIGFSAIIFSVSMASYAGWTSAIVIMPLIIGSIIIAFYVRRQFKLENPILNLKIFKIPAFSVGASLVMLNFSIILGIMYLLPLYLQNGLAISVGLTGIIMLPGGILNAVVSAFAGRLYDNIGAKLLVSFGFIIVLIGSVLFLFTSTTTSIAFIIMVHLILMIGCPLIMSPAQTSALNALPGIEASDGSTIMNSMQQIVGALATALETSFLSLGVSLSKGSTHTQFTNGFHYGVSFLILLSIIALFLTLKVNKKPA